MPNTGRVKFFSRSELLASDGVDAMASSGGNSVSNLLSFDRTGYWQSDDQQDGTASTISINFRRPTIISRLLIVDTNVKDITINFNAPLANIVDIDNLPISSLSPYANNNSAIYLEFDAVEVLSMDIIATNTQTPDQRKYIRQIIAANEIGAFTGFPEVSSFNENHNPIVHRASTGVKNVVKQIRTIDSFNLRFKTYPVESDISLSDTLYNWRQKSFSLWPCGGGYGSDHFLFEKEGWRLQDIYNVQTVGIKSHKWWRNLYKSGVQTSLRMVEVI